VALPLEVDPVGLLALGTDESGEPGKQVVDLSSVIRAEPEGRDVCEIEWVAHSSALSRPVTDSRS